jgi:hypothetical protein
MRDSAENSVKDGFLGTVGRLLGTYDPTLNEPGTRGITQNQNRNRAAVNREYRQDRSRRDAREARDPANGVGDHVADFVGGMAASAATDPTTYVAPGRTAVGRVLAQTGISGGVDAALQGAEVGEGRQDEIDWERVGLNAGIGTATQSGGEVISKLATALRNRRPGQTTEDVIAETVPEVDNIRRGPVNDNNGFTPEYLPELADSPISRSPESPEIPTPANDRNLSPDELGPASSYHAIDPDTGEILGRYPNLAAAIKEQPNALHAQITKSLPEEERKGRGLKDLFEDDSGSVPGGRTPAERQALLRQAKALGIDTSNIADLNEVERLVKFHSSMMGDVRTRAKAMQEAGEELHKNGTLPMAVGTRFTTSKGRELGQGPWEVIGHYVDSKDPNRYGYWVQRGKEGVDFEKTMLMVSDPAADARTAKLGRNYDRAADVAEWKPLGGPRGLKALFKDEQGSVPGGDTPPEPTRRDRIKAATEALSDVEPGGFKTLRPFENDEPDYYRFRHVTDDGKEITGTYHYNPEEGVIDNFSINSAEGSNGSGPAAIRRMARQLQEAHPEAKSIKAYRTTGGRVSEEFVEIPLTALRERRKVGSIGPGQNIVPESLEHFPVAEQPSRSRSDTEQAGEQLGLDEDNFATDGKIGDVAAVAARGQQIVREAGQALLDAVNTHGPGSDEYAEAVESFIRAANAHSENSSNLGRGLQTLNNELSAAEAHRLGELASNPATVDKFVKLVEQHIDDPEALEKIARDAVKPTLRDFIFSYRYNMMLSGPKTHVYNIGGTTGNLITDMLMHGAAVPVDAIRGLFGATDRVTAREFGARLAGLIEGAKAGAKSAKTAFKEGRPADDRSRADMTRGKVGKWEIPVKLISAEDDFFRSAAYYSNVRGAAVRKAIEEGQEGADLDARIAHLTELALLPKKELQRLRLNDETAMQIVKESEEYAKRMRFQDDPSALGQAIENLRTHKPKETPLNALGKDLLTLAVPFVRTPDSLVRTALRYSPLGIIEGKNWEDIKAGGARRTLALNRVAFGSAVSAYVLSKVFDGGITGEGPSDLKVRQAMEAEGWQPKSIWNPVTQKYTSYEGLEPLSIGLSTIATTAERWNEVDGKTYIGTAALTAMNFAESVRNVSWLEGLNDLIGILDAAPGQKLAEAGNFTANIASSFAVPAVVRQVNQTYVDPVVRDTRGDDSIEDRVVNRIKSGWPGMSDDLPAQLDALGREQRRGDALGPDLLSRAITPYEYDRTITDELSRLRGTDPEGRPVVNEVDKSLDTAEYPIGRLTAQEQHDYQMVTGAFFSTMMEEAMQSPEYKALTDDEKRVEVGKMMKQAREWAREDVFLANAEEDTEADAGEEASPQNEDTSDDSGEEFTAGIPTSMRRTVDGNRAVGGVDDSAHLDGDAIDFLPADGVSWEELVAEAKQFFGAEASVGIHGKGSNKHVHVQLRGMGLPLYGERGTI